MILTDKPNKDAKEEAARQLFYNQSWIQESAKADRSIYECVFRGEMLGLPMQCKIDWMGRPVKEEAPIIIDLKTTRGKSGKAFFTSVRKFSYYMQAYIYMEGIGANAMAFYFVHSYGYDMKMFLDNVASHDGYILIRRDDNIFKQGKEAFERCVQIVKDNNYNPLSFKDNQ